MSPSHLSFVCRNSKFCGKAFVEHRALMQHAKFCFAFRVADDAEAAEFKGRRANATTATSVAEETETVKR